LENEKWRMRVWRKKVWRSRVRRERAKTLRAERRCPNKGTATDFRLCSEFGSWNGQPACHMSQKIRRTAPRRRTPVGSCAQRTKGQKGTTDFGPGVDSSENNKSSRRRQSRGKPTRSQITTPSTRGHATSQEGRAVVRLWFQEALSWREPAVVQAKSRNGDSPKPREPDTAIDPPRAQDVGSSYIADARSATFRFLDCDGFGKSVNIWAASCGDSLSRTYSEKLPCELSCWLPKSSTADVRGERWRRLQDAN